MTVVRQFPALTRDDDSMYYCCAWMNNEGNLETGVLTGTTPIIGGEKENWLFQCDRCGYTVIFTLWKEMGLSTACSRCRKGDMKRMRKLKEGEINE